MIFRDRPDGRKVRHDSLMAPMLPYVMRADRPTVYFSRDIDVEASLPTSTARTRRTLDARYSLFGLILAAAVRTFALKPKLNRFVSRRGVYQRNELCFSFIVKRFLTEEALERSAKVWFEPEDTVDIVGSPR